MKRIKRLILSLVVLLILAVPVSVIAAPLPLVDCSVDMVKLFGGGGIGGDSFTDIRPVGSNFIISGYVNSQVTDFALPTVSTYGGGAIMKVSATGTVLWGRVFEDLTDPLQMHMFMAVEPVVDGYIAVGNKIRASYSDRYALAVKYDLDGNVVWQKTFGAGGNNQFLDICPSGDGNVVVAGIGYHYPRADYGGLENGFVMKLNATTGDIMWQTPIGGTLTNEESTYLNSVEPSGDGGFVICGQTRNNDGDFSGPALGYTQAYAIKLNSAGVRQWTSLIGGSQDDAFFSITPLVSGNYMAVGRSSSIDGDFASTTASTSNPDAVAAVLSGTGAFIRYFRLSGNSWDDFRKVVPATDGGIAFGWTESTGGIFTGISHGYVDGIAAQISETDGFRWITNFGGTQADYFYAGLRVSDAKVIAVGKTRSTDGDLTGLTNRGYDDMLLTAFTVSAADTTGPTLTLTPNTTAPTKNDVTVTVTASDPSGVAKITLPNGTVFTGGSSTTFTVSTGGDYTVTAEDGLGHVTSQTITISNIDKVPPTITLGTYNGTTPTKNDITVTATSTDGTLNATSHTFTANGFFDFVSTDAAGNVTTQRVTITNIDKTPPVITLGTYEATAAVDGNITVTATTDEGTLNAASHTFTVNGSFDFVATDAAGNVTTESVTITNIHKIPKILSVTGTQRSLATGRIELTVTVQTQWFPVGSPVIFDLLDADKLPLAAPVHGAALVGDDGKAILVIELPDGFVPGAYFLAAGVAESNVYSQDNPIVILAAEIPKTGEAGRSGPDGALPIALALLLGAGLLRATSRRRQDNVI